MIGTVLKSRYRIDAKLGEGGMGVVYRAHDTLLDRPVAIKALSQNLLSEDGLRRLLREAQAAAKLTHANIVAVYDVLEGADQRTLVMEYVAGQTLREQIPLPWERAVEVAVDVSRALAFAHDRGIVHRDIKPENIMVTPEGTAKVMDFGLARSEGRSRMTQTGMIVGTVAYMAPEQVLRGEADARSDLYSLGCVLYETLTGKTPFVSDDPLSVISQHIAAPPVSPRWANPHLPTALEAIVMKLLAKDPAERYPSAAVLMQVLEDIRRGADTGVAAAPSPSILEALRWSKLVGRDRDLDELKAAVDRMLGGTGGTIFVVGEPGIGKTRLCQEQATYARLRGCRVWSGEARERESGLPYGPFTEAFKIARGELLDEDWAGLAARWPELAKVMPDLMAAPPAIAALPPEQERVRLFEQVAQALTEWSKRFPIVLHLDDLHWTDVSTLELLRYVARVAREVRILLVGTYRDVEVSAGHPLPTILGDMNRERLYQRILLRRLDEDAVTSMIAAAFDEETGRALLHPVYQETEGNPFFIEEVLKDLVEIGTIYKTNGGWAHKAHVGVRIPESVREAVGRRLSRLSDRCRHTLTSASVIGRDFTFDVLRVAAGVEEESLLNDLDEALAAQLIRPAGRRAGEDTYTFQHALIRETLYDALNPRRRVKFHRQVGEAYEQVYSERLHLVVDDLAYHFGRADQSQADKGIRYNLQAAERVAAAYAHEGAETLLRVALELAEAAVSSSVVTEIHERLGDLYVRLQEGEKAVAEFERALETVVRAGSFAPERAAHLRLRIVEACADFGVKPKEVQALARSLVESAAGSDSRFQASALGALALLQLRATEYDRAEQTALKALEIATPLRDPRLLSRLYGYMTSIYWELGRWDEGYAFTLRRLEPLSQIDDLVEAWHVHTGTAEDSMIAGKYSLARAHAEQAMEVARKIQSPKAMSLSLYNLSWVYYAVGNWRESVKLGEEGLALGQRVGEAEGHLLYLHMWVGLSAAYLGDEQTTRRHIAACETLAPQWRHGQRDFVQARLLMALDDLDAAARHVAVMPAEWPPCAQCQDLYRLVYAEFYARTGEPERAEGAAREVLRPEAGRRLWMQGEAYYGLGLAALTRQDPDAAIEALTAGRDLLEEAGHIWTLAQTWKELGRASAARGAPGDMTRAHEALAQARDLFARHGAEAQGARVAALLEALA